ncbi:MAG TPA: hypothetical protein VL481_00820 [Verrucomicrobiae bacterium]|nr:hypothetical protein [Verrucomicrobiae bacterium]
MSDYGTLRRHVLALPFELIMLGGAVAMAVKGDQLHLLTSMFTFSISFLPLALERWLRVRLPVSVHAAYVAFIFASMFSGEVFGMYGRVWVWDDWMHFISGVLIGIGVVLWIALLNSRELRLPPWLQGYLVLGTAALLAVIWELAEFASDQLFGTSSQGGDLADTMYDLLYDLCGAGIVAAAWRLTSSRKDAVGLYGLVTRFLRLQS